MSATPTEGQGSWSHCLWCPTCEHHHGPLYICEHYPQEVKDHLQAKSDGFRRNLRDPAWIQRQLDNGISPEVIVIFGAFMGER